jgi:hypothetical protein
MLSVHYICLALYRLPNLAVTGAANSVTEGH